MKKIQVKIKFNAEKDRSYPVFFGPIDPGLVPALRQLNMNVSRIFLISAKRLSRFGYPQKVKRCLEKLGIPVCSLEIPDGEEFKTLATLHSLYRQSLAKGIDRRSLVVALGGGVLTDIAGFFAGTIMRGVPFVSIPTTLLGMVDAAIGGKTGVDLKEGKNLVGLFYQPRLVWIDARFLKTLPQKEWTTGFAEVIKYGVIRDARFFYWLVKKLRKRPEITRWPEKDLLVVLQTSARNKADVVSGDENETPLKGGREILNFGHTIGHALEAATGYSALSHGEAVSIGMAAAGLIAREMGLWSDEDQLLLLSTLQVVGLPIHIPARIHVDWTKFWRALRSDKKIVSGRLRFVLPVKIGRVTMKSGISVQRVKEVMGSIGYAR